MSFHFNYSEGPADIRLTGSDLRRVARVAMPSWPKTLAIMTLLLANAGLGLVPPLLIREVIDRAIPQSNRALLCLLVVGMIAAALLGGFLGVLRNYLVTIASQDVMLELRSKMFGRLIQQPLGFFIRTRAGELLARVQSDVDGVHTVVSNTAITLALNSLVVLATLAVIFAVNWQLACVATCILPLFILPARQVGRTTSRLSKRTQEKIADLNAVAQETLSVGGSLLTRLFGLQLAETERFSRRAAEVRDLQVKQRIAGRWFLMWIMMFSSIGPAAIYLVGGLQVISGALTLGTIVAFVSYLAMLYAPVSSLVNAHVDIMKSVACFRRIFEYLDLPLEMAEPTYPVVLERPQGELRFDHVSLRYDAGTDAVKDVSFTAAPGQMIAIVGPSGAGKTSLAYLAARIYDPNEGRVSFDGIDVKEIALTSLSAAVAVVTQDTTLFNATIAENLRYAKREATQDELVQACRLAQIHEVISGLPLGYQTAVGERGYKLSGGEKQRIAIARVILRNPRLLILDEATSALDSNSETLVQQALEQVFVGRTSLVIAHRLSTILRADSILVLDKGRIVQRGKHEELLRSAGLYAHLFHNQFKDVSTASPCGHSSGGEVAQPAVL